MTDQRPVSIELDPSISDRIHNAIKIRIAEFRFPVISYKTGLRSTKLNDALQAQTILVRSQQVGFRESRTRKCGGRLQERTAWIWVGIVHFDRQVNLDSFEEDLMRDPIRIPRDDELDQQIDISFVDAVYEHPPEKESSYGTRVTYRFQADLSPL